MWNIDPKNIEKFLTSRHIGTSRELILVSYNITQALDARDAMVKKVYAELFQYVVDRINVALSAGGAKRHKFIGVLDIFGFESFAVSFQLFSMLYYHFETITIYIIITLIIKMLYYIIRSTHLNNYVLTFVTRNFNSISTNISLRWNKHFMLKKESLFQVHPLWITNQHLIF
jgi:hypothetical protein